ncbi:DUF5684 domain-containing protein [Microbacterium sp. NPDC089987]|uniref:DUF5684 domain-containing protein n=1 Tax=Microbacterium sp. NPDC089987 TaxID=3364202 RepID=UPI00382304F6
MTGSAQGDLATIMAIVGGLVLLITIGCYVWYALALSRLFPRIGGEGWKGWVPILNEAEILARGGVPAWSVVFYFIPLVQLYGLYLKIVATHRINKRFGRGGGMTALAVLLPPVWATVLAWGVPPYPEGDRLAALQPGPRRTPQPAPAPARDASGYAIPSLAPPQSAPDAERPTIPEHVSAPAASQAAGSPSFAPPVLAPPVQSPPVLNPPTLAPPVPQASASEIVSPTGQASAPAAAPPTAAAEPPVPPAPTPPAAFAAPAAPAPPAAAPPVGIRAVPPSFRDGAASESPDAMPAIRPAPAPIVSSPPTIAPPPPPAPPAPTPSAASGALPAASDAAADAPAPALASTPLGASLLLPGAGLADEVGKTIVSPRRHDDDDDFDATVVVARKQGVRRWLVLDDGRRFALSGARVVIGRNPVGEPGEQRLAVSDTTRTLSKTHARLVVQEDEWRLTDLHATNGVVVVADDGAETLLDAGESVVGTGRFILGEVGMHVIAERDS